MRQKTLGSAMQFEIRLIINIRFYVARKQGSLPLCATKTLRVDLTVRVRLCGIALSWPKSGLIGSNIVQLMHSVPVHFCVSALLNPQGDSCD